MENIAYTLRARLKRTTADGRHWAITATRGGEYRFFRKLWCCKLAPLWGADELMPALLASCARWLSEDGACGEITGATCAPGEEADSLIVTITTRAA